MLLDHKDQITNSLSGMVAPSIEISNQILKELIELNNSDK